jgi:large subunit ribosomal protein L13
MNTTVRIKASQIYKDWHVIDAAGRPLGRVASEAAVLLRGKHKPTYEPHLDDGDFVIIVNASQVKVTGRKAEQIKYHTHSGYPGGLRTRTFVEEMNRHPERIIEQAVYGMLPKGSLGEAIRKHLKVYRGQNHPHQSQIIGSQKARAAREAAMASAAGTPMKAPRLRPLSVPHVPSLLEQFPEAERAVEMPAPKPRRAKVAVPIGDDESSAAADALLEPAAEPVPPPEPPPAEAPKPRARRTKATAAVETQTENPATPPAEPEAASAEAAEPTTAASEE